MVDQVAAAQQLHGNVRGAVVFARVVDRDDVRVIEPPRHFRLAEELGPRLFDLVGVELGRERNRLQGDLAVDHRVERAVDDAHRALAELVDDLVTTQLLGHGRGADRSYAATGVQQGERIFGFRAHGDAPKYKQLISPELSLASHIRGCSGAC